jgi:hypothetical protein
MKQFVILFRQGPFNLTEIAKAHRQAAISLWAREQNARGSTGWGQAAEIDVPR